MSTADTTTERQLQLWDSASGRYVPHPEPVTDRDHARSIAKGRAWRIARPDRPLEPRYRPPRCLGSTRTVEEVRREYLNWALDKGIPSITLWKYQTLCYRFPGVVRRVTPEEYFAVEHVEDCAPEKPAAPPARVSRRRARPAPPIALSFYSALSQTRPAAVIGVAA